MIKKLIHTGVALLLIGATLPAFARESTSSKDVSQTQPQAGQTITVKGVVYDDQGEPLPGAGVIVKGTTKGTVTDLDGSYELKVTPNQVLVISFVGFKDQEIPVNGRTRINATLASSATTLDDVVVVGYGAIKKANLTGAVDVVDSKAFENRVAANVDQMLLGNMPNVSIATIDGAPYRDVNNLSGYQIRGVWNTLASSSAAGDYFGSLVLIDGVEGDPASLNPNDIESVSVLKDAAASAIYGSRGAYGVMLITTKNAPKEEMVTVSYSGNYNFMTPTATPDLVTDGELYTRVRAEAYYGWYGKYAATANVWPAKTKLTDINAGYLNADKQAALVGGVYTTNKGVYEYYGNTDWWKAMFKDHTASQIHNVSVSGNNGKVSYLLSGRMYDYDGIYVGKSDPYKKYNLRSKVDIKITDWLSIGENIEYAKDNVDYGISSTGDGMNAPQARAKTYGAPTWPIYNPDGTFTKAGGYILSGLIGDAYDPISYKRKGKTKDVDAFRTSTSLTAAFFNNALRLHADYTYRTKNIVFETKDTGVWYSDGIDPATGQAQMTFSQEDTGKPEKNDIYRQSIRRNTTSQDWSVVNAYAEYENTFDRHWLKGMVGYNYEKRNRMDEEIKMYGLDYWDADAANPWAYALGTKERDGSAVTGYAQYWDGSKAKHWRNAGVFFRANYAFDDRYLLEFNGRYDGSSVYVNQYQWGFFPSASAAWRVSQEHWWKVNPKWISALKFRVSYGVLGDCMSAGAYNTEDTFDIDVASNRVINGSSTYRVYEVPDVTNFQYTWSKLKTFNVGADASFFNNRLDITYDYFIRRNTDMLTEGTEHASVYGQYGDNSNLGNNASMSTYGWELSVQFNQPFMLASRPGHFGIHASISDNYTIVDEYNGNESGSIRAFKYHAGQHLGDVYGLRSNGLFKTQDDIDNAFGPGKPYVIADEDLRYHSKQTDIRVGDIWIKDLNGDGKIDLGNMQLDDMGDLEIIANKWPRLPFSFGIDLDWANWYLSANFQGIIHHDFIAYGGFMPFNLYANPYGPMTKWSLDKYAKIDEDGTFLNPDTAILPVLSQGNRLMRDKTQTNWNVKYADIPIDTYVYNAGYINLQNLQFGYNLPRKLISKIGMTAAKIYFSGENLWNWSPFYKIFGRDFDVTTLTYAGDDPTEALNWFTGYGFQYPKLRTFSLGLNVTFGGKSNKSVSAAANTAALAAAISAANAAAETAKAAAEKAQTEATALKAELANALKAKEDCENAPKPMSVRRAEALHVEDVYFELNQSVIRDTEKAKVDNLVKVLNDNPDANVDIFGYADQATGTELRNLVLTKERAEAVAAALKAAGIAPERIRTEFHGTEKDSSFTPENNRLAVCIVNN